MTEYIISEERLADIQKMAWHAGRSNIEPYELQGADGPEIVRCRDCDSCCLQITYGTEDDRLPLCTKLNKCVPTDGTCFAGKKREHD